MEFRTIVPLPDEAPVITPATHALVLGSCFAEHIGERLQTALGPELCCVNPFGVLYNPMSIAQALQLLLSMPAGHDDYTPEWLDRFVFLGRDGLWHSWLHSTHYSAPTREECIARCTTAMAEARRILSRADLLIVTFGTSRCYMLNPPTEPSTDPGDTPAEPTDFVVANCHKELATRFTERDCTVDEIVATWRPFLADLQRLRPELQVVFTVSPYRYRKYGYHASQLAKARLLLAVEELISNNEASPQSGGLRGAFPAYEIVLDELRDYRFYKPDMLHPSEQAVDYIWERFSEWAFSAEMHTLYHQRIKKHKALNHHANH